MKISNSKLTVAVCLFVACLLVNLPALGQKSGPANPSPVIVVNGNASPVPTVAQGTTNVAGTVSIGNTPSVSLAGTPSVSVANTPTVNVDTMPPVQMGPSQVTHMGRRPSEHVVLFNNSNTLGCTTWYRVAPDGNANTFAIPQGEDLVLTDMEFSAFNTISTPGTYEAVELSLGPGNITVLGSFALVDSSGDVFTAQHLTSGIVMSILPTCSTGTGANTIEQVVIRGYLIPAS